MQLELQVQPPLTYPLLFPTYFSAADIQNCTGTKSYSLIDGGVGQNNPSKMVIDDLIQEAHNIGDENKFFLLSLGKKLKYLYNKYIYFKMFFFYLFFVLKLIHTNKRYWDSRTGKPTRKTSGVGKHCADTRVLWGKL